MPPANTPWPVPDRPAAPEDTDVHVYQAIVPPVLERHLIAALSADERARAAGLRVEQAARRFVMARAVLRHLLGTCLDLAPAAVPIAYAPQGKPHVAGTPFHFNLSHAGNLVLVAITRACPLGIDVECLQPPRSWAPVAARFFTAGERTALAASRESDPWRAFLTIWTRKEALVKLSGEGMWSAFKRTETDRFDTSRAPALINLAPAPGYLAALALGGRAGPVRPFTWHE